MTKFFYPVTRAPLEIKNKAISDTYYLILPIHRSSPDMFSAVDNPIFLFRQKPTPTLSWRPKGKRSDHLGTPAARAQLFLLPGE
jgi:hypothetical protein